MAENSDGNKDGNSTPINDIAPTTDDNPSTPQTSEELEGDQLPSPQVTDNLLPSQSATDQNQALSTPSLLDVLDGWISNPGWEQVPTAPPMQQMDKVPGYENVSFYTVLQPPPQVESSAPIEKSQRKSSSYPIHPPLSEDQAKEALLQHVAQHCCFGRKAAREMVIRPDIENIPALHYTLETFTEKREIAWVFEPYTGQPIDSPINGLSPAPWDIGVAPFTPFKESKIQQEIPHTASVKHCHDCSAIGKWRCATCLGQKICSSCGGSGKITVNAGQSETTNCKICKGRGRKRCDTCFGQGQKTCLTCNGKRKLKCFIQLTVTRKNHINDFIVERTSLPDEVIRTVSGQLAFEEEAPLIEPVTDFPYESVNKASSQLIQQHSTEYNMERVLRQRHRIRIVPVSQVNYTWNNKPDYFIVFGFENKVHAPTYPQKCCCGCSIL